MSDQPPKKIGFFIKIKEDAKFPRTKEDVFKMGT